MYVNKTTVCDQYQIALSKVYTCTDVSFAHSRRPEDAIPADMYVAGFSKCRRN